ncbi:hypothetical protein [Rossellomorea vietnamensis]|uniref:hypothetical protein n=1 Tax=Rossellomorea vietnamensis TaxID=218284 RepID=UPI000B075B31|nr:hypothetical protein [Rossellomorea vietnamensis]
MVNIYKEGAMAVLSSLRAIEELKSGNTLILREHKWLKFLSLTKEKNVNLEQVESLEGMAQNPVLEYVERTLHILDGLTLPQEEKALVEEVLLWSETAKCGLPHQRREWLDQGFQLGIHNIGSAQIYASEMKKRPETMRNREREKLLYVLILTHGLPGQYIRGEGRYSSMKPLIDVATQEMFPLLYALNQCIVAGVSPEIWDSVQKEMEEVNRWICDGEMSKGQTFQERLRRLRNLASLRGENFDAVYNECLGSNPDAEKLLERFFRKTDMWYVEASLTDFSFEECIKIFLLIERKTRGAVLEQLSFEPMMKELYYDYKGRKIVNVYKKRIIESYLAECTIEEIAHWKHPANEHVQLMAVPLHAQEEMAGIGFFFQGQGRS